MPTVINKFIVLFLTSFLVAGVSFAGRPIIFTDGELASEPNVKLMQHNAHNRPAKSVWLLRESTSIPGAVTLTYYDQYSGSPDGFANSIYVFKKSSGWTLSAPSEAWELKGPKKDSFIPISADTEKEHREQLQSLYGVLKTFGLNISGQVFPNRTR